MKKSMPPYVAVRRKGGREYYYFRKTWSDGAKQKERLIRLPDDPDSPEFSREYWAIRSGTSEAVKVKAENTWRDLIISYRQSAKFQKLASSTKTDYDRVMDEIAEKNGHKSVKDMTRDDVMAIHAKHSDKPRKADRYIQTIRMLLNFAIYQRRWKIDNVAEKIELYGRQREFESWPDWMIERLEGAPDNVSTAAELILGTGQRPNAAILMRRDQFNGEWMTLIDEKQDETFDVFCPPQLRWHIESLPKKGQYVLAKNLTQPLGYDSVEREFRNWRASLGERARK